MDVREKLVELLKQMGKREREQGGVTWYDVADQLIANGVTVQEWISVKDRLPSANGKYLCHIFDSSLNNLSFMAMVYYDRGNFIGQSTCVTDCVTHWMPLPQPPKGE